MFSLILFTLTFQSCHCMQRLTIYLPFFVIWMSFWPLPNFAQLNGSYVLSGKVTNERGEPLMGTIVAIKGTPIGTITDSLGTFSISTNVKFPIRLVFRNLGFQPQELEIRNDQTRIHIQLNTQFLLVNEVVITASQQSEQLLRSPVTIEKLNIRALKETPAPSFYDAIGNLKGVQMTTAGLTFKIPNTRGFNVPNNFRFMQLVDGVDNQAATLGVPLGNAIGPTELDILSVELTPGASAAPYGMNALNGLSNLRTKNPFQYQGLSVFQQLGLNHFDGSGSPPAMFMEAAIRYAKALKEKWAFKVNASYLKGLDNYADNHNDFNPQSLANPDFPQLNGTHNIAYDGWNKYGDERNNQVVITDKNGKTYHVRRTGYWEKDLVDYQVKNAKFDAAIHYRLQTGLELSYTYRIGTMDGFFQRGNRINLKDVVVQNHKIELSHSDFTVRSYVSIENTGHSANLKPLADNLELSFKSNNNWAADYTQALNNALNKGMDLAMAHQSARSFADSGRFVPGTPAFYQQVKKIRDRNDWDIYPISKDTANKSGGAALWQYSRFYHVEGRWNLKRYLKPVDVLVGADYRLFEIIPDGNNFVDFTKAPDQRNQAGGQHLFYGKAGGFLEATKTFFSDALKLTGSLRYDKNQEFAGKLNPRFAVVYTLNNVHNFRFSWQNGFRFPSLFEAFSFVNNGQVRRVGGLQRIESGLGYFNNSFTTQSVEAFNTAVNSTVNATAVSRQQAALQNANLLTVAHLSPIAPEGIHAFEVGYKSVLLNNKLFIDIDAYYNTYHQFIGQVEVVVPKTGNVNILDTTVIYNMLSRAMQNRYRVWTNSKSTLSNYGFAAGVSYHFLKTYALSGNLSYNALKNKITDDPLVPGFNTPNWFTNISFGNRAILPNLGFNLVWHWQDSFFWENLFGDGNVPAYNTLDAQVTLRVPKWKSHFKIGGSNVLNTPYYQYVGGPTIRGLYYLSWTLEDLLRKNDPNNKQKPRSVRE